MTSEAKFQAGDKVLVNGSLVAEIETYDEELNVVRYTAQVGGGSDTTTGHISQTRIEHLVQPAVGSDERPGDEAGQHAAGVADSKPEEAAGQHEAGDEEAE